MEMKPAPTVRSTGYHEHIFHLFVYFLRRPGDRYPKFISVCESMLMMVSFLSLTNLHKIGAGIICCHNLPYLISPEQHNMNYLTS